MRKRINYHNYRKIIQIRINKPAWSVKNAFKRVIKMEKLAWSATIMLFSYALSAYQKTNANAFRLYINPIGPKNSFPLSLA